MTKINNTGIISKKIVTDNLYNTQGDKYLTGWGIKESWAKLIAGAIIGAICAFSMTSCSWDLKAKTTDQIFESTIEIMPIEVEK